jgi:methyl-accepting chemotaxis protein
MVGAATLFVQIRVRRKHMPRLADPPHGGSIRPNGIASHDKTSDLKRHPAVDEAPRHREPAKQHADQLKRARTAARQQQIAEGVAAATRQLSAGLEEASSAVRELTAAIEQISKAAQQASSATAESLAAISQIERGAEVSARRAQESLDRVNRAQELIRTTTADIEVLIQGVNSAAQSNLNSAKLVAELEKQAGEIGNIVQTVVGIAKQTNLLALNAAIEAARAGEHGRGFAVVADEVRNLAETSEKAARDIRELVDTIRNEVEVVAKDVERAGNEAASQVEKAAKIAADLKTIERDMAEIQKDASQISDLARQAASSVLEFKSGAEQIAKAAEAQAASVEESLRTVEEQNKALADTGAAASELAEMAEALQASTAATKSGEELAAAAEELSATIEEANRAAHDIAQGIQAIASAAEEQSAATEESARAAEELEQGARAMKEHADRSRDKVIALQKLLAQNKAEVTSLIEGISKAVDAAARSAENIARLEVSTSRIDKIVDAIVNVTIQTNLLAVNGAIEAARAGEYGRGFAVVAADVRSLAKDSAENVEKIKDLVKRVQQQVAKVALDIEQTGVRARQEVESAKKSTANLVEIESAFQILSNGASEIATAAQESLNAIVQARRQVDQIAQAAQEVASATEEVAQSSDEQARALSEQASAIEQIAALADEFQNLLQSLERPAQVG